MKRIVSTLLVVFVLCGCVTAPVQQPTAPASDVLDGKLPLDSLGAFYDTCIPLPEGQYEPELYYLDGDLLLVGTRYDEEQGTRLMLHRLNTYTGQVVSQLVIPAEGFAMVQIYGDTVCLSCPSGGKVWFLDSNLKIRVEYTFPSNYNNWYISPDMQTLYQMGWDVGLTVCNLADGKVTQLLPSDSDVSVCRKIGDFIAFSYVDPKTQMTCGSVLHLATGKIRDLGVEGSLIAYDPNSDLWLSNQYYDEQTHILGDADGKMQVFNTPNAYCVLTERGEILLRNYANGQISLYTTTGNLISRIQMPADETGAGGYISDTMVWDPVRGGYFLLYTVITNPSGMGGMEAEPVYTSSLAYWDLTAQMEGQSLSVHPYSTGAVSGGVATEQAVYQRAEEIGNRFGVRVLVADQCLTHYDSFDTQILTDPEIINMGLTELERALGRYPDGFLQQLRYGTIKELEFSIVGELTPLREDEFGSVTAFAQPLDNKYIIVADGSIVTDTTFHHELSHVIDHRLEWDADHRENALYSEDAWAAMNPKGFAYDMTYALHHDRTKFSANHFMSSYACTYPTEDRATIWEQAMVGNAYPFTKEPMHEKLEYYSACVRDCFDTTGWPAVLPWEAVLR